MFVLFATNDSLIVLNIKQTTLESSETLKSLSVKEVINKKNNQMPLHSSNVWIIISHSVSLYLMVL